MSKKQPPKNPVSDEKGSFRVFRGGGWDNDPNYLRAAQRAYNGPSFRYYSGYGMRFGFRIVRNIPKDPKEKRDE